MAVLHMQRILICALRKDRKAILELLQRRGVIEVNDVLTEDSVFHRSDSSLMKNSLTKTVASAKEAIDIIDDYCDDKASMLSVLSGLKEASTEDYDLFRDKYQSTVKIVNRILTLSKEIAENKAEILKFETQIEILTPWVTLDIPMNFEGTKYTKSFIGTLPKLWTQEEIYEKLAECTPLNIDIISSTKDQTCIFILCQKNVSDKVFEVLRSIEFASPGLASDLIPSKQLEKLEAEITITEENINKAIEEIKSYQEHKDTLHFLQDYDTMREEKYEILNRLVQSKNVFVITGYIPEREVTSLSEQLNSRFEVSIEIEEPEEEEETPVLLQNNAFSRPLEGIVASYSPPKKGEIDPTTIMSLFYYVLFGIMLSDAGYGFLIAALCAIGLMKYGKKMEDSMKNTLRMYLFCGISTVFWGVMFGSYFGDVVDVVSENYFGQKVTIPALWFLPMNEPMRMLTFAMALGVIHLLTGLVIKLYQLLKAKDYKAVIYDVVFWLVLLISCVFLLLSMPMITNLLGVSITLPNIIVKGSTILAIATSVGIILTNGRESRNPIKRFLKGLYAFYGISGYLSDVLSYSRLLALGLATGVIGMVINKMAAMAGKGIVGPLIFTIIFIFGHTLNLAINALGAYVHTNRLQYVEFFGKFYEGGGRTFNPFKMKTKYYKIKEKIKNEN
jgi:V/A-type H+-transporting ATPase subunit I